MSSLQDPGSVVTPNVKYRLPAVHPEGIKFVVASVAITGLFFLLGWEIAGWLMVMLTIWVAAFFRDPLRVTPASTGTIVSPADGLVCQISQVAVPRQLDGDGGIGPGPVTRVSVFMSVFDVHVNRAPIPGTVSRVVYVPGKFVNADLDKASEDNERQYFIIDGRDGTRVAFTQIAGLVARRILRFTREGDVVGAGQRIGLIRFGSRCDVYLPAGYTPQVLLGQRTIAGETVIARADAPPVPAGITQ